MSAKSIVSRGRFTVRCDSCRWEHSSDVRQTRQYHDRLKADHNEIFHPDGRDISNREAITRLMASFPHDNIPLVGKDVWAETSTLGPRP